MVYTTVYTMVYTMVFGICKNKMFSFCRYGHIYIMYNHTYRICIFIYAMFMALYTLHMARHTACMTRYTIYVAIGTVLCLVPNYTFWSVLPVQQPKVEWIRFCSRHRRLLSLTTSIGKPGHGKRQSVRTQCESMI